MQNTSITAGLKNAVNASSALGIYFIGRETLLTPQNAPSLIQALERLSKKAGIVPPPLFHIQNFLPNAAAGYHPTAKDILIINEGAVRAMGMKNMASAVTPEMEAMLAHELGHLKEGVQKFIAQRTLPLIVMPIVATTAYTLYAIAHQRAKYKDQKINRQLLENVAEEEKQYASHHPAHFEGNHVEVSPSYKHHVIDHSKILLADALGLGAGLMTARQMSLASEFRQDMFAAKLTSPEAMISQLKALQTETNKVVRRLENIGNQIWPKLGLGERIRLTLQGMLASLQAITIDAHPSYAERIGALKAFQSTLTHTHF